MTDEYEWSDEAVEAFKDAHDKIWYNDGSWPDKNAAVRYGLTAAAKVQGLVPAAAGRFWQFGFEDGLNARFGEGRPTRFAAASRHLAELVFNIPTPAVN